MALGTFPFGQPVERVAQADRRRKRVFVLGVYASAVHARWYNANGKRLVHALGIASEPSIFWRGDAVEDIVSRVYVPPEAGRLEPAKACFNGPSGRSLDEHFLEPLGLTRDDAWLCDLVPYSCMNNSQAAAISKHYAPLVERLGLSPVDWPARPSKCTDAIRRKEVAAELRESAPELVVTLGDEPLKWFAAKILGTPATLAGCQADAQTCYGAVKKVSFEGRSLGLLFPSYIRDRPPDSALTASTSRLSGSSREMDTAVGSRATHVSDKDRLFVVGDYAHRTRHSLDSLMWRKRYERPTFPARVGGSRHTCNASRSLPSPRLRWKVRLAVNWGRW